MHMNEQLIKPIEMDEVKKTVFELGSQKSPGPDGFQGTLYQT